MEACLQFGDTSSPLLKNANHYQRLLGKLIYLTITRLDVVHMVRVLSQFMQELLTSPLGGRSTVSSIHEATP